MRTLTIQDIKTNGSKAISDDEVSYLIVNSQPKSALVPIAMYEEYVDALDELEDLKAVIERSFEEDIPADEVFKKILKKS